jgi:hypothetical protein
MADTDKGYIDVISGSIGDLIFRIETLTSDRDTIKLCVRAAKELSAMTEDIKTQAARIAALEVQVARLLQAVPQAGEVVK